MTEFEEIITKIREGGYCEGIHFNVLERKNCKQIAFRTSILSDNWTYFEYDNNGNLIKIF